MGTEWPETPQDRAERKRKIKCTCNGMEFICNRWVFTGQCKCRYLHNRPSYKADDYMTHDLDCTCIYCIPGA